MYGFEPAIVAGASADLTSLVKVDLHAHLGMLRQLGGTPRSPFSQLDIAQNAQ
jgi:hypothetical protein